jgi:hypothetical protein
VARSDSCARVEHGSAVGQRNETDTEMLQLMEGLRMNISSYDAHSWAGAWDGTLPCDLALMNA